MEQQSKPQYQVPTSTVVEVTAESIICTSTSQYTLPGYDSAIEV